MKTATLSAILFGAASAADVTCEFTADNWIYRVFVDGNEVTDKVQGNLMSWPSKKTLTFPSSASSIAISAADAEKGCANGGVAIKCVSSDAIWSVSSNDRTKFRMASSTNSNDVPASDWFAKDFKADGPRWDTPRHGYTTFADRVIGVEDLCAGDNQPETNNFFFLRLQVKDATTQPLPWSQRDQCKPELCKQWSCNDHDRDVGSWCACWEDGVEYPLCPEIDDDEQCDCSGKMSGVTERGTDPVNTPPPVEHCARLNLPIINTQCFNTDLHEAVTTENKRIETSEECEKYCCVHDTCETWNFHIGAGCWVGHEACLHTGVTQNAKGEWVGTNPGWNGFSSKYGYSS